MSKLVSLKQIKAKLPCVGGWENLLKSLNKKRADNTKVSIGYIAKSNSVSDALWVLFNVLEGFHKEKAYLMADIAESVVHLSNDARVPSCIQAVRDFADGKIARVDLDAAGAAAGAAWAAARAAARDTAGAAWDAAGAAAGAAWDAARDAAGAAAWAAGAAARAAARDTAGAAWDAENQKQIDLIIKYFGE